MPGKLIRLAGPAGSGKSTRAYAMLRDGEIDLAVDTTTIWAALKGVDRGPDGRFPVRLDTDPLLPLVQWAKTALTRSALQRDLRVAKSSSTPVDRDRDQALAADEGAEFDEEILDPGEDFVRARLADENGNLSEACETAIRRWYPRR